MQRAIVAMGLVLSALGGCASAQEAVGADQFNDREYAKAEAAFARAREPHRGHVPFAVARVEPFNEPNWFVASFFSFWTGYSSQGNAKQHWAVRKVFGSYVDFDELENKAVPGVVAREAWAVSDTCPALERAVGRFEIHDRTEFTGDATPPSRPDVVVVGAYDATYLSFWAALDAFATHLEINLLTPYRAGGGVADWVGETMSSIEGCWTDAPPDMPELRDHEGKPYNETIEPFSIFDLGEPANSSSKQN